jgi:hypothetical protein
MYPPDRPDPPHTEDCPENWQDECVQQDDNGKWYVDRDCDCSQARDLRDERKYGLFL